MTVVNFFTNVASHYREPIWSALLNSPNWETHFYYSDDTKWGVEPIDFSKEEFSLNESQLHKLKSYWWKDEKMIWQKGVIRKCLKGKFEHAVFIGEVSRLYIWIAAIVCRMRGIKVTFWGHGLYGNESKFKLIIRKIFFRLANYHLLYERRAKELMTRQGFSPDKLYVIFNSLDYDTHKSLRSKLRTIDKTHVFSFLNNPFLPVIIFIGRLTVVKKLDMLFEAVNRINESTPKVNLVIIGDGPEKEKLERAGIKGIENKWLYFTGACYDEEKIGQFLSKSDLCVSPGNVGLTAVHSLSFGTPVCTHDNMSNQMPEAGAIQDGYSGFFFKENDIVDLKKKIENWFSNNKDENLIRDRSYEIIDKYYNPHYQLTVIDRLVNGEKPEL